MLREFTVSSAPRLSHVWGGGWPVGQTPLEQGWRVVEAWQDVVLIGRPGQKGCATYRPISPAPGTTTRLFDVAVYGDNTPEEVIAEKDGAPDNLTDGYHKVDDVGGFGVVILRLIAAAVADWGRYRQEHAEPVQVPLQPTDYGDCPPDKWNCLWPPFQG